MKISVVLDCSVFVLFVSAIAFVFSPIVLNSKDTSFIIGMPSELFYGICVSVFIAVLTLVYSIALSLVDFKKEGEI